MVQHAIKAMKKAQDIEINEKNIDISVLGDKQNFEILKENEIKEQLKKLSGSGNRMVVDS